MRHRLQNNYAWNVKEITCQNFSGKLKIIKISNGNSKIKSKITKFKNGFMCLTAELSKFSREMFN